MAKWRSSVSISYEILNLDVEASDEADAEDKVKTAALEAINNGNWEREDFTIDDLIELKP